MKRSIQLTSLVLIFGFLLSACAGQPVKYNGSDDTHRNHLIEKTNRKI